LPHVDIPGVFPELLFELTISDLVLEEKVERIVGLESGILVNLAVRGKIVRVWNLGCNGGVRGQTLRSEGLHLASQRHCLFDKKSDIVLGIIMIRRKRGG